MLEEVGRLMHEMSITKEHAEEIINIYLECGNIDYRMWLKKQVRVFPANEETWKLAKEAEKEGFLCLQGNTDIYKDYYLPDQYYLITDAEGLIEAGIMPNYYPTILRALERCQTLIEFEIYDDSRDLNELVYTCYNCGFNLYYLLEDDEHKTGFEYENVFNAIYGILEAISPL